MSTKHETSKVGIGSAVPNAQTKSADRGTAKIGNVDPSVLSKFSTWAKMKTESARLLKEKEGRHVRNYADPWAMQNRMYNTLKTNEALAEVWNQFRSCQSLSSIF